MYGRNMRACRRICSEWWRHVWPEHVSLQEELCGEVVALNKRTRLIPASERQL
ncbi:hypothetical protein DPMN_027008 [Dreissena polymorpha]|uniref:Uncharacterized protein n=1 Tax=Dreissena polymorpha TaxID=45954 RepID=A0A9D4RE08_DREPO|nr:hypothetical protein DPMN_027008 [Dreissena polymorpha]